MKIPATGTLESWERSRSSVISLDPGSTGTGIAVWDYARWKTDLLPEKIGNVFASREARAWQEKVEDIAWKLEKILEYSRTQQVYCEYPHLMGGAGGNASAGGGNLVKLAVFCGVVLEICRASNIPITFFEVREWKGMLSKNMVIGRVRKRVPDIDTLSPSSHMWDAIAIGLFAKGKLHLDSSRE